MDKLLDNPLMFLLLSLLAACGADDSKGSGDSSPPSTDNQADTGEPSQTQDTAPIVTSSDAPVILAAEAPCAFHDVGDSFYYWSPSATVDDPQGLDTIPPSDFDNTLVMVLDSSGSTIYSAVLACTGKGLCSTYFTESDSHTSCANADQWTFRFQVADEDGNVSEPYEVKGYLVP